MKSSNDDKPLWLYLNMQMEGEKLNKRHYLTVGGLLVLFVHFSFTSLYTVPPLPAPQALKDLSRQYMYPMFHQGWQLFAPDVPHYQTGLFFRSNTEGEWSAWKEAGTGDEGFNHFRLKYVSRKLSMVLNSSMAAERTKLYYYKGEPQYDKVVTGMGFNQSLYFCAMQYKFLKHHLPDSLQLRMEYEITPDFFSGVKPIEDMTFTFPPQVIKQ